MCFFFMIRHPPQSPWTYSLFPYTTCYRDGCSARAVVLAMGGGHQALGFGADAGETLAFQPLRRIDDATERSWAAEWIAALLAHEKVVVTPEVKDAVWSALGRLPSAPPEERTLTGLTLLDRKRVV